jgi:hypothetical protein
MQKQTSLFRLHVILYGISENMIKITATLFRLFTSFHEVNEIATTYTM